MVERDDASGRRSPRFIAGIMLIPPASTFALVPCSASSAERLGELVGRVELELARQHQPRLLVALARASWIAVQTRLGRQRQLGEVQVELRQRVLDRAAERAERAADARLADALRRRAA